jgi:arsenite methyltransferase
MITVMRWLGKAPVVHIYDRETIFRKMREVGFVDVVERDVGANQLVAFIVAQKPTRIP